MSPNPTKRGLHVACEASIGARYRDEIRVAKTLPWQRGHGHRSGLNIGLADVDRRVSVTPGGEIARSPCDQRRITVLDEGWPHQSRIGVEDTTPHLTRGKFLTQLRDYCIAAASVSARTGGQD